MTNRQTSYDAIPYPSIAFPETHPDRLSAVAMLFGLKAPPPATCRVLELGCSTGINVAAIAQIYPGSKCLGIDASSRQIAEGWQVIEALGLKNVQLKHLDILEIPENLGEFDYIISHGVFSWVPARVQDKILEVCKRHLAPDGVAYLSYNTFPGWHIRGIVRDMMFYRGMQFAEPEMRLAQAKSLVEFVAQSSAGTDNPYQKLLQAEFNNLGRMTDHYLHHEHLEEHNQPIYFYEFARRIAVNGLQYLGDADFSMMVSTNFSPEVAKTLNEMGAHDIVQMEQYMDFVRCRYFRKTLICHAGKKLNRRIDAAVVKTLMLASNAVPEGGELDLASAQRATFGTPEGRKLNCRAPLTKLALRNLGRAWPMPVAFSTLFAQCVQEATVAGHLSHGREDTDEFLAAELLTAIGAGVIEWRITPAPYTTEIGQKVRATPLARWQAERAYRATNLRGELTTLDEIHRQTLKLLDGQRSLAQIIDGLAQSVKRGELLLHRERDKTPVTEDGEVRTLLGAALPKVLDNLARRAFLAGPVS